MNAIMPKDFTQMNVQELARFTKEQEIRYKQLRDSDMELSIQEEKIYVESRTLFFRKLDMEKAEESPEKTHALIQQLELQYKKAYINQDKKLCLKIAKEVAELKDSIVRDIDIELDMKDAMPLSLVIDMVLEERKNSKTEPVMQTGIKKLDNELTKDGAYEMGVVGGLSATVAYRLWAGKKSMGKTTLMLQIMSNISKVKKVAWIDFEMGRDRATDYALKRKDVPREANNNIEYYEGNRELSALVRQIKILKACGVNHFFIDSVMKITIKGKKRGYETASTVHDVLQKLTRDLGITIDMIVQMSNEDIKNSHTGIKNGGDAEYEADGIFYLMPLPKKSASGRIEKNDAGVEQFHTDRRLLICDKNRETDRLFELELYLTDIMGGGENMYRATEVSVFNEGNIKVEWEDENGNNEGETSWELSTI